MQRAAASGGQAGFVAAVDPTAAERLDHVGKLLAEKKPWPAFLHLGARATEEWELCPAPVQEALTWMATATVGVLDIASVGPLVSVCQAFSWLIEAAESASISHIELQSLISRCAFLTTVLIQHGRAVGPLAQVQKPMKDFVATTIELAAFVARSSNGGKCRSLFCHHADLSTLTAFEEGLRHIGNDIALVDGLEHHQIVLAMHRARHPPMLPDMASVPRGAISLTDPYISRPSLLGSTIAYLTDTAMGDAPCDQLHEWLKGVALQVASTSGKRPPVLGSLEEATHSLNAGKFAEADVLYERSEAIREKVLGPDHPDVAQSLMMRADWLGAQCEKRTLYTLGPMKFRIQPLGEEHPDSASGLTNRMLLLSFQGKYEDAEPLYQRSVAIREKALGPDHPAVATALNNWAALLTSQGKYAEADALCERSQAIREKALGPQHPDVAQSLMMRADWLKAQGKYEDAEPLFQRSVAIREKSLGPDHPAVATALNNWAASLASQGKYAEVDALFERSQAIREKMLGPDHPDVAQPLMMRADWLGAQGKYEEAEPLYQRSVAIREKALGPDHPAVATGLNNWAALLTSQGKYAEANALYERSQAIREKVLGPDHPDVAQSLMMRADWLGAQGKFAEADVLYERSQAIREKVLGPDHPDVAQSLMMRADWLGTQ
ncbi:unnamed protein product, partial [Ectocarpus fasciculatus]